MLGAIAAAPLLWPAMRPAQQARPATRAIPSSGDEALLHQRVGWADKPSNPIESASIVQTVVWALDGVLGGLKPTLLG